MNEIISSVIQDMNEVTASELIVRRQAELAMAVQALAAARAALAALEQPAQLNLLELL